MDSDEEEQMFAELFEEEMAAATQDEEHMLIIAFLSGLYTKKAIGQSGFSALQKCTVAMRMLAYGAHSDVVDDYLRMAESTTLDCFYRFCRAVIIVSGDIYLRSPTVEDTAQILAVNEARGIPGMLGSIGCMHYKWKNCLFAWHGMYKGHKKAAL
ncbi:hypothetical protein QYE76_009391 [Lolium multiflorum]|uniref:Uncharacterized protein n=1 Tax=Lolium multiflorum TaxID=4521 RepID=A0AAD8TVA7_LOLMU|nr:hypothetical protein QYE76_009391 [Lolium multiflorum]